MSESIKYKGYTASMAVDPEANVIHGEVFGLHDVVTFQGETPAEAVREFHKSVDEYLAFCREIGREPDRPYNGRVLVRLTSDLHRDIDREAKARNTSINDLVGQALAQLLEGRRPAPDGVRVRLPKTPQIAPLPAKQVAEKLRALGKETASPKDKAASKGHAGPVVAKGARGGVKAK